MKRSLEALVADALEEDIGQGDLTTLAVVPAEGRCEVRLVAKEPGVLSGIDAFHTAFKLLDYHVEDWNARLDGERFDAGDLLASFSGTMRWVLTAERTALNFVQHLSGVATLTAAYCAAIEGLSCRICDTRKTTPLLRRLEKAAVVHGGGVNHRYNLSTGILIKENHIACIGSIQEAIHRARAQASHLIKTEVEVPDLASFDLAMGAGAEIILLDNMSLKDMKEAVRRRGEAPILLEASGNATLDRVRAMAETGVDLISVGALTHSAPAIDMTLLVEHG